MYQIRRWLVWLSRIHRSGGFGIQSPTDYAFVRSVVNEHWPYYAYADWKDEQWLIQKLGRLYFRLANWRQPSCMLIDQFQKYWQAGSRNTRFVSSITKLELCRVVIEDVDSSFELLDKCDEQSVLVVEGIYRDKKCWSALINDMRIGTTFDLYYCGIVLFDKRPYKHHYTINF